MILGLIVQEMCHGAMRRGCALSCGVDVPTLCGNTLCGGSLWRCPCARALARARALLLYAPPPCTVTVRLYYYCCTSALARDGRGVRRRCDIAQVAKPTDVARVIGSRGVDEQRHWTERIQWRRSSGAAGGRSDGSPVPQWWQWLLHGGNPPVELEQQRRRAPTSHCDCHCRRRGFSRCSRWGRA